MRQIDLPLTIMLDDKKNFFIAHSVQTFFLLVSYYKNGMTLNITVRILRPLFAKRISAWNHCLTFYCMNLQIPSKTVGDQTSCVVFFFENYFVFYGERELPFL